MATQNEKLEVTRWLNNLFGDREKLFSGSDAEDKANELAAQQPIRWKRLHDILSDAHDISGQFGRYLLDSLQFIFQSDSSCSVETLDGGARLRSNLPLLMADVPQSMIKKASKFPLLVFASILSKCQDAMVNHDDDRLYPLIAALAVANLEAGKAAVGDDEIAVKADNIAASLRTKVNDFLVTQVNEFNELRARLKNETEQFSKQSEQLHKNLDALKSVDEKRRSEWENEKTQIVEGIRREAMEFAKIESSMSLWNSKATWHMVGFGFAAIIFSTVLLSVPYLIIEYGVPFIGKIAADFAGDKEFLGLTLLVIPTLAIAWFLRFVARIAIQNLALSQDARQRHTQVTTYLRLLGDESQPISKDERILALAALFRPLPGHGSDDISPPTIAELLKEAADRITKK